MSTPSIFGAFKFPEFPDNLIQHVCIRTLVRHAAGSAVSCSVRPSLLKRDVKLGRERLAQDMRHAGRRADWLTDLTEGSEGIETERDGRQRREVKDNPRQMFHIGLVTVDMNKKHAWESEPCAAMQTCTATCLTFSENLEHGHGHCWLRLCRFTRLFAVISSLLTSFYWFCWGICTEGHFAQAAQCGHQQSWRDC